MAWSIGLLLMPGGLLRADEQSHPQAAPKNAADLFVMDKVWTVHFQFTPEQWKALQPAPPARGPGGPPGFGPGMFLAPFFLQQADQNHDGKLTRDEMTALGERWFTDFDKDKTGKLTMPQLRAGLNKALGMPQGGPGGGAGGPPPGMNLQGPAGGRNGLAAMAGINFKYVHADLDFAGKALTNVGVRYKGNGTWMQSQGTLKHSLKVDFNHFVKGQELAGLGKINFHNCVTDASWMNEVMSHRLFRDAGVPAPRTSYARVLLTVPGEFDNQYLGLYSIVEDVDSYFVREHFGDNKGAIFKPVTPNPFAYMGDDWSKYNQTYDPKTKLSKKQMARMIEFCKLVSSADDKEFAAKLPDYVNLDEFSRFMAVQVWLSTLDSILAVGQNYYVFLNGETNKLEFFPWDLDHSFGQFFLMGTPQMRENLSVDHPWKGNIRFFERVFAVDAFRKLYRAKLDEFSKTIFKPERFEQQVDQIAAAIRSAVAEESPAKVERLDKVVAGEPVEPAGFGPPPGGGPGQPGRPGQPGSSGQLGRPGQPGQPAPGQAGSAGGRQGGPPQGGPPSGGSRQGGGPEGGGAQGGPPFGGGFAPSKPIKGFVKARFTSVTDQLAGKSEGQLLDAPPPGRPGANPGQPPPDFGPGAMLGGLFMARLDANKDGQLTREELVSGFGKWFDAWDEKKLGQLTEPQLRDGIDKDINPMRGGGPPGPGNNRP